MHILSRVRYFVGVFATVADSEYRVVINVMKRDLTVIHAEGMLVPHLEEILQSTDYRGFPVVKSPTDPTVLGFIRKTELRFSLGRHAFSVLFRTSV